MPFFTTRMTQETALTILKTGANVFLTGEPGAGKTHTVNRYIAYLRAHGIEPAITASTGIAATHVGGMTIHSWSGIGIRHTITANDIEELSMRESLVKRVTHAKVLIIDEISMLDARVLSMVETVCRSLRRNEEAFGGMQVVFVGDFFQLPPVVRYGEPPAKFCFEAKAWASTNPVVCYLTEQHRQNDDALLDALALIRRGDGPDCARGHFEPRYIEDIYDESVTLIPKLYTHNADVDRMNTMELAKLPDTSRAFTMTTKGKPGVIETLKRGCLSPENLELKKDAVVMFTKNNFEEGYVNGTLGTIVGFDEDDWSPIVETRDGKTITARPMDWEISENGKVLGGISQIPLRLAWAITIHKSQGMSMDAAVINLSSAFEYGQGYVALSRVRTLSGMFLLGLNDRALEVHPTILKRDAVFQELSDQAQESFTELGEKQLTTLHHNFIIASGGRIEPKVLPRNTAGGKGKGSRPYDIDALRAKHPNIGASWDKAQEAILTELFNAGEKTKDIAEKMGRKSGGIRARLKLLGLIDDTKTPLPREMEGLSTREVTKQFLLEQKPLADIALARGFTKGTIVQHIEEMVHTGTAPDITYLKKEITDEKFDSIRAAFEATKGTEGEGKWSPVKALLGDDVSFDDIRLAKLFL